MTMIPSELREEAKVVLDGIEQPPTLRFLYTFRENKKGGKFINSNIGKNTLAKVSNMLVLRHKMSV